MIKNYLLIAFRNLIKYKSFSSINIIGMGISLATFILISIFVMDELKYDRYHPDGDQVFRLYAQMSSPGSADRYTTMVQPILATKLNEEFPEVEKTARVMGTITEKQVQVDDKLFNETRGAYGEGELFDILAISLLEGNPNDILKKANTVAISQSLAYKYFGKLNAIGQTIKIENADCEVTHVFYDFPDHSHAQFDFLISFSSLPWMEERIDSWTWHQMYTYVKVSQGTVVQQIESKFQEYIKQETDKFQEPFNSKPFFQSLNDIYLGSSHFEYDHAKLGNKDTIYILIGAAIMILLISSFNFVNLSTARAVKRMQEVGVRKVIGAQTSQLKTQFLLESCLFVFIGFVFALGLSYLSLPFLSDLTDKNLSLPVNIKSMFLFIGFGMFLGIISGSYPAFMLSSFKPVSVISGATQAKGGHSFFRQSLVVFQLVLSFILIIGAWVVIDQNNLLSNKHLGFNKETLMVVYGRGVQSNQLEPIKNEVLNKTEAKNATWGYGLPGDIFATDRVVDAETGEQLSTKLFMVDHDYIKTMGMEIVAGRDFSRDFGTDPAKAFIVNETAVINFGLGSPEEALGRRLSWDRWNGDSTKHGEIVGVVRDFHTGSLKEKITPLVMQIEPNVFYTLTIKLDPEKSENQISSIESIFREQVPNMLFSYSFIDQNFEKMYMSEQKLSKLLGLFAGLTILVACMGLFGLVEYHVHQRAKEISIRKIFGADTGSILLKLTKQYFILILVSFVLATPLIWFVANKWLQNFAYHVEIRASCSILN
ncbi:ABC transporter permease [Arthrospiribacter ruber]|uniref:FtsX-like permease family protein n=1 Tax=Arthrospiribacter ruber TaxID=2487934 RepID=A0A951J1R3_9BACT|nr:ABC transporter permease [Arthrospiribacter ruber]MBW3470249.1 FtsX-like permease family protein [Arthrospiribacter ruber]